MTVKRSKKNKREQSISLTSQFSFDVVKAKTANQKKTLSSTSNLILYGPAGTGKTFLALSLGLNALEKEQYKKIMIIRSIVATRPMGYLPGDEKQKAEVFEAPYMQNVNKLAGRDDAYSILRTKNVIDFQTTSFIRGLTWDNTFIIIDEAANLSFHEINSIITRIGNNCRVIFCGDERQSDLANLRQENGFRQLIRFTAKLPQHFEHVEFTLDDIVRSDIVGDWCRAVYEDG